MLSREARLLGDRPKIQTPAGKSKNEAFTLQYYCSNSPGKSGTFQGIAVENGIYPSAAHLFKSKEFF
jgi:hypothetical protein